MSALNKGETEALRHARAVIDQVLRLGYSPSGEDLPALRMRAELKKASDEIRTVVTMKGHYPNG